MSDRDFQEHQSINQSAVEFSAATIKSALLINGAAAVAVLSFAANLIDRGNADVHSIASSLMCYVFGVVFAVLGFALAYLTNYLLAGSIARSGKWKVANKVIHVLAVLAVLSSVGLFVSGSYAMKNALVSDQENAETTAD